MPQAQLFQRIRVQMRKRFALAAQVVELAALLRLLNLIFNVERGHAGILPDLEGFYFRADRGIQDPYALARVLCVRQENLRGPKY